LHSRICRAFGAQSSAISVAEAGGARAQSPAKVGFPGPKNKKMLRATKTKEEGQEEHDEENDDDG
jgi:hypothetical protein